jgi:hypothetical protein
VKWTESSDEETDELSRPYTSHLNLLSRSAQDGPSPNISNVISDAGDQQELRLQDSQGTSQVLAIPRNYYNIEESLTSLPPANLSDDLQTRLHAAFRYTMTDQVQFLPLDTLYAIVTPQSVAKELNNQLSDIYSPEEIEQYATMICSETEVRRRGTVKIRSFRKIFALLVIVEATTSFLQFIEEDISNLDLPLTLVKYNGIDGLCRRDAASQDAGIPLECLRRPKWSLTKLRLFEYYQWKLGAPFFYQEEGGDVKHYKLKDNHILPFTSLDNMPEREMNRKGEYKRLQIVDIHPGHHSFRNDKYYGRGFAVQHQIHEEHRSRIKKEIDILKKFSGGRSHPHIVFLLATYEQFKKYHLIFRRAEGDLFTYWKQLITHPKVDQRNVLWMAEQCRGIADGLLNLHRLLIYPISRGGYQKDLAENVAGTFLYF